MPLSQAWLEGERYPLLRLLDEPLLLPSLGVEGRKAAEAALVPLAWEEDLLDPEDCDWVCLCWLGVDFWLDPDWDWVCLDLFWEDIVEGGKLSPKIESMRWSI